MPLALLTALLLLAAPARGQAAPAAAEPDPQTAMLVRLLDEGAPLSELLAAVEAGADPNVVSKHQHVALMVVAGAEPENEGALQRLLDAGSAVDMRGKRGATALLSAVGKGHAGVARLLLDAGADVNAQDARGISALMMAAQDGNADLVQLLLERGADVDIKVFRYLSTPLWYAAAGGHEAVMRLLIAAGADLNASDANGITPLMIAEQEGRSGAVRVLSGADWDPSR